MLDRCWIAMSGSASSGSAAVPATPAASQWTPVASICSGAFELSCQKCGDQCAIKDSKATGRNPHLRIETNCSTNKRNMERKVQKRDSKDPLSKWWKGLSDDPEKEKRWYQRMKTKLKNAKMSDQQIMAETEEVQGTGVERRGRAEYYGFDTVEADHPDWSQDQMLEHWRKLVAKSKDKLTDKETGETMIAMPRKIIIDDVENNMRYDRVKRQKLVETSDDLRATMAAAAEDKDRFRRSLRLARPVRLDRIPAEAKHVDSIDGNMTDSLITALGKSVFQQSLVQDMVQAAVEQAHDDEEMLHDVQIDIQKLQERAALAKTTHQSPEGQKSGCISLNTVLIEKCAKLDSSIVRQRGDAKAVEVDFSFMTGQEKTDAEQDDSSAIINTDAKYY